LTEENENNVEIAESPDDSEDRVAELESLLETRDEELVRANARLVELEQALAESEERLNAAADGLKGAVSSYKSLVVQSNPDVLEELITGDSIEGIDLALKAARELIGRVKTSIEAEMSAARVPAGAPPRASTVTSALSPREKIQQGMERVKS
jgi:ABC-type transporter Mla subunit MlaD